MDYFLTTYRKDYKWPVTLVMADNKKTENDKKMMELQLHDTDPHIKSIRKPMVKSEVEPGKVVPAHSGVSPQGEATKYDQPNTYLQKLYRKYPYIYNVLKFTTTDEMAKRVMSEKYKTTYQMDYNKEGIHKIYKLVNNILDDFSTLIDVVKEGDQATDTEAPKTDVCLAEGLPAPKCKCSKDLKFTKCQCAKDIPVRRIAWKPAPISNMPQPARDKSKKKKDETDDKPKVTAQGAVTAVKPFTTEYNETISKIGSFIIKNKLLYKETIEATEDKMKKKLGRK